MIFLLLLPNTSVRFQKAKAAGRSNSKLGTRPSKNGKRRYADGGRIDFIKRAFEYRFLLKNINTVFLYPFSNLKHLPAVQTVRWFASAAELPAGCRRQPNYPADAEQQGSCFLYFFVL